MCLWGTAHPYTQSHIIAKDMERQDRLGGGGPPIDALCLVRVCVYAKTRNHLRTHGDASDARKRVFLPMLQV